DRDDGASDVRVLAHRDALETHQPEDDQHQADDGREDRTADRDLGDTHGATSGRRGHGGGSDRGRAVRAHFEHLAAVAHLLCALDDDALAMFQSFRDLHHAGLAAAGDYFALGHDAVLYDEHEDLALLRDQRPFRNEQRLRGWRADLRGH